MKGISKAKQEASSCTHSVKLVSSVETAADRITSRKLPDKEISFKPPHIYIDIYSNFYKLEILTFPFDRWLSTFHPKLKITPPLSFKGAM